MRSGRLRLAVAAAAAYLSVPAPASAHGGLTTGADDVATILVVLAIVALASFRRHRRTVSSPTRRRLLYGLPIVALALIGAALVAPSFVRTTPSKNRPVTAVRLQILSPEQGATVGSHFEVRLALLGGRLVDPSTVRVSRLPDNEGHIHVLIDGKLVSMTQGLEARINNLSPGPHAIEAQFVAIDHAPFKNPVLTSVLFTVQP